MPSFSKPSIALAALAVIPAVTAHGTISGVVSGGTWYKGTDITWVYGEKPAIPGWYSKNQDNGYVSPSAYGTDDIACHIDATPGMTSIPVTAGETIDLQWTEWPESHHGPLITYLASCGGDCTSTSAGALNFFKIDEAGLIDGSANTWATDEMISNNGTWSVTIPSGISGNFVIRNEIIALHSAGQANGAQNYPQCLNLKISGSGSSDPCGSGADCAPGSGLYSESDPGILVDIYSSLSNYEIPGPALWSGAAKRAAGRVAKKFFA